MVGILRYIHKEDAGHPSTVRGDGEYVCYGDIEV